MKTFGEGRRGTWRTSLLERGPAPLVLVDVLQSVKTAAAGVIAWFAGTQLLGLEQPFLAPWAAILVVHSTVYRSVSRGGQQIVATFLGVLLAWACGQLFGIGPLGMGVMLLAAYTIGWHRWLRDEASTMAGTGVFTLATNAIVSENLLTSRLLDTTAGIVVGLLVNLLVFPPLRDRAAWQRADELPNDIADLLDQVAAELDPHAPPEVIEEWVAGCRRIDQRINEAWGLLGEARESSRLNPRRQRPAGLDKLVTVLHLLEETVADMVSMARTIAASVDQANVWDGAFRARWAHLVSETARGVHELDDELLGELSEELRRFNQDMSTSALTQEAWHEYGGVLVNLRNMLKALRQVVAWRNEFEASGRRTKRPTVPDAARRVEHEVRQRLQDRVGGPGDE